MKKDLLTLLTQMCSAFFDRLDRKSLLSRILDTAIQLTSGERGTVFVLNERNKNELISFIATGLQGKEIHVDASLGAAGHVYMSGMPILINDAQSDPRFYPKIDEQTHFTTKTILCVPLRTPDGRMLGVIEILNSKEGRFQDSDLEILQVMALFAAIALDQRQTIDSLNEANQRLRQERSTWLGRTDDFLLKSTHRALQELYNKIPILAESDSSILIEGESGTGKEVVAKTIHLKSKRAEKPFIAVNCAAIPETLFEAELFGVSKGAATGTVARKGKIELAEGGTLFLDEIGELPLSVQSKLLRVLQDKVVSRVGSDDKPQPVDFRVLVATNRNLDDLVQSGKFREDLYYRLNVIRVRVLPLRERPDDIPVFFQTIMKRFERERGWKPKKISKQAMAALKAHSWPGNVRELENKLESAMILSSGKPVLNSEDFNLDESGICRTVRGSKKHATKSGTGLNLKKAKNIIEKELVIKALQKSRGNKTEAAKLLGVTREGLRKAMIKLRIQQ